MNSDGLPIIGHNIDLTQIEPISPQRTLTYINHFILETVSSLNKFSSICDYRLHNSNVDIQGLEASLSIIEGKLSSIEWLNDVKSEEDKNVTEIDKNHSIQPTNMTTTPHSSELVEENKNNLMKNKENPLYKKYFTMLSLGIPLNAVKQKMLIEKFDPNIIDNPDATSTVNIRLDDLNDANGKKNADSEDNSEDNSECDSNSDFSD